MRLGKDLAAKIRGCDVELLKLNQEELDILMSAMLVDMQVTSVHPCETAVPCLRIFMHQRSVDALVRLLWMLTRPGAACDPCDLPHSDADVVVAG